jgi:hypothetical protein
MANVALPLFLDTFQYTGRWLSPFPTIPTEFVSTVLHVIDSGRKGPPRTKVGPPFSGRELIDGKVLQL